jgi:hypothetical protein
MKQCRDGACFGIDTSDVWPFVSVTPIARECKSCRIVAASVLPRNYMFDMESNERRRLLWYAAILTSVACALPNSLTETLVHLSALLGEETASLCLHD